MTVFRSLPGALRAFPQHVAACDAHVARARNEGRHESAAWRLEVERVLVQSQLRTAQRMLTPPMLRALLLHGSWSVDHLREFVSRCDVQGAATVIVGELADLLVPHLPWCFRIVASERDDRCVGHALLRLVPLALWHGEARAAYAAVHHWTRHIDGHYPRTELDWLNALLELNAPRIQRHTDGHRAALQLPAQPRLEGSRGTITLSAAGFWTDVREVSLDVAAELGRLQGAGALPTPIAGGEAVGWRALLRHERLIRSCERAWQGTSAGRFSQRVALAMASRLPGHRRRLLERAMQGLWRLHPSPRPANVVPLFVLRNVEDTVLSWLARAGVIDADAAPRGPLEHALAQEGGFADAFGAWARTALRTRDDEFRASLILHLGNCLTTGEALVELADHAMALDASRSWLDGWCSGRQYSRAVALGAVLANMPTPQALTAIERYLKSNAPAQFLDAVLQAVEGSSRDAAGSAMEFVRAVAVCDPLLGGRADIAVRHLPPSELVRLLVRLQERPAAHGVYAFVEAVLTSEVLASWLPDDLASLAPVVEGYPHRITRLALGRLVHEVVTVPALLEVLQAYRLTRPGTRTVAPLRACIERLDAAELTDLLERAPTLAEDAQALLAAALAELESLPDELAPAAWAITAPNLSGPHADWHAPTQIGAPARRCMLADPGYLAAVPLNTLCEFVPMLHARADPSECAQLGRVLLARWWVAREHGLLQVACTVPEFVAALLGQRNAVRFLLSHLQGLVYGMPAREDTVFAALLPLLSPRTVERLMLEHAPACRDGACDAGTLALWVHGCRQAYVAGRRDAVFAWLRARRARMDWIRDVWTVGAGVLGALAPVLQLEDVPHWLALFHACFGPPDGPRGAQLGTLVARGIALGQPFDVLRQWVEELPPAEQPLAFDSVAALLPEDDLLALWDWLLERNDVPPAQQADISSRVLTLRHVLARVPALTTPVAVDRMQRTLDLAAHMDWHDAVLLLLATARAADPLHGAACARVAVDELRVRVAASLHPW